MIPHPSAWILAGARKVPGSTAVFALLGGMAFPAASTAQSLAALPTNVPELSGSLSALPLDVNSDGALDLLVQQSFPQSGLDVYLNDGLGRFTLDSSQPGQPGLVGAIGGLERIDFDGDGDEDLFVADGSQTRLYRNDGRGVLTLQGEYPGKIVGLSDLDGDGELDLVAEVFPFTVEVVYSIFRPGQTATFLANQVFDTAVADLDGDGNDDIYVNNTWYRNVLPRTFLEVTTATFPPFRGPVIDVGDVDGDGREEIFFSSLGRGGDAVVRWGATDWELVARISSPGSRFFSGVGLVDMDGDGFDDVVTGLGRIAYSNGLGGFSVPERVSGAGGQVIGVEDFDGDGRTDLLFSGGTALVLQTASGVFTRAGGSFVIDGRVRPCRFVDMDLDGRVDVVASESIRFRGERGFDEAVLLPELLTNGIEKPIVGDFDGDGDPDVIGEGGWLRNDGARSFQFLPETYGLTNASRLFSGAAADFDQDGVDDLVSFQFSGFNTVDVVLIRGDGTGGFTAPVVVGTGQSPLSIPIAADLNNDGIPDLAFGGRSGGSALQVLLSANSIPLQTQVDTGFFEIVIDVADDNGDGFADLLTELGVLNSVSGTGTFTIGPRVPSPFFGFVARSYVDLDRDGRSEALLERPVNGRSAALLSRRDAQGNFIPPSSETLPVWQESAFAIDVDDDGDLDLTDGAVVLTNLDRQLHVPFLGRVGGTVGIQLFQQPGANPATSIALVFASPRTARVPLPPFGVLGLDANVLLPVGSAILPVFSGEASLSVVVPNDPAVAGVSFPVQAVFAPVFGTSQLSNVGFIDVR